MKFAREIIAYVLILVLLCMDFFSQAHIWTVLPKAVVITVLVIAMIICFVPAKKLDVEANFWLQLRVIVIIVIMILVLPLFGGKSDIGLSLTEPFFIIVIALSLVQIRMQWKRVKAEKEQEEELKKQQEKQQGKRK